MANESTAESLAQIALDTRPRAMRPRRARTRAFAATGMAGLLFSPVECKRRSGRRFVMSLVVVSAALFGMVLLLQRAGGALARRPTVVAKPLQLIEVAASASRAPTPATRVESTAPSPRTPPPSRGKVGARAGRDRFDPRPSPARNTVEPPSPAQAGGALTASEQVADFTSFGIATGSGGRYAGGYTAGVGSSTEAVHRADADPRAVASGGSAERSVGLPAKEWRCPWPTEAESLDLQQEEVTLRLLVGADGAVREGELLRDPGNGFGRVALECAKRRTFSPATNGDGAPIAARSPPIRIRFVRHSRS